MAAPRTITPGGALAMAAAMAALLAAPPARADRIRNGAAVFSGLDKITGRIISFRSAMGETVQFGSLQVTARACYTRPAKEAPLTDTFVEVDEVMANRDFKRIFSGWMFAASPGLHGLEHPIYDIWLTGCEQPGDTVVDPPQTADADGVAVASAPADGGTAPTPAAGAASPAVPAPAPAPVEAAKPRARRAARPAPRPEPDVVAERRPVPRQRFFPAIQYPAAPVVAAPAEEAPAAREPNILPSHDPRYR